MYRPLLTSSFQFAYTAPNTRVWIWTTQPNAHWTQQPLFTSETSLFAGTPALIGFEDVAVARRVVPDDSVTCVAVSYEEMKFRAQQMRMPSVLLCREVGKCSASR
jgi:hypothetical protein